MRKFRLIGATGLAVAAFAIPASTASADTFIVECPDGYQPVPAQAIPPQKKDKDRNMNLFVCAKGPQGSNQHFNVKDDHGVVVDPLQWTALQVPNTNSWLVVEDLDDNIQYSLDPEPNWDLDVIDDIL